MRYLEVPVADGVIAFSKIVLGTDYYGTLVARDAAFALYDLFVAAGGNCIDTARFYADWIPGGHGASEALLGEWLKSRQAYDKILISTKGGHPPLADMAQSRLSRDCLENDLNESLAALGVERIDLYWLHRDDRRRPVAEIMESLAALVASGKVRAIGCSNWQAGRIAAANAYANANGLPAFCMSQIQWSLAASTPEAHQDLSKVIMNDEEYRSYLASNLPVMAYSSQAKGFFSRPLSGPGAINEKSLAWFCSPENLERKARVEDYAAKNGLAPGQVALAYVLCNRLPAMALVGCRNLGQLRDTLAAADILLPPSDLDALHAV